MRNDGTEVRVGPCDVIHDLAARARERLSVAGAAAADPALARVPGPAAVLEPHVADRDPKLARPDERRIADLTNRHIAGIPLGPGGQLPRRRIANRGQLHAEMFGVPVGGAERLLMPVVVVAPEVLGLPP